MIFARPSVILAALKGCSSSRHPVGCLSGFLLGLMLGALAMWRFNDCLPSGLVSQASYVPLQEETEPSYRAVVFSSGGRPLLEPIKGCQGLPETLSMTNFTGPFRAHNGHLQLAFDSGILH